MSTLNAPILAFVFALLLLGYSVVDLDRLPSPHAHGRALARPALVTAGAGVGGTRGAGGPLGAPATGAAALGTGRRRRGHSAGAGLRGRPGGRPRWDGGPGETRPCGGC